MGQLTNQYVSSSYQGLLKMTDSTSGITNTLQTIQAGDGSNSPLQMSLTQVNISGSFTVNGQPVSIETGSFATTGSNTFVGKQTITGSNGSLTYDGTMLPDSTLASIHANDDQPWLERFYNDTFSPTNSVMSYFAWNDGRFIFHNESTQSISISTDGYVNDNLVIGQNENTSNNDLIVSGAIKTNGAITFSESAFNSTTNVSGALYFSSLNNGTLHLNDDGGEGDVFIGWGPNNIHIRGNTDITGSLGVTNIKGTGSLFLQPDQSDVRFLEIYNTSPTDTHITASGGQLFLGNDVTYVKVDNYGSVKHIDIVADNGVNISGSVQVTGSIDITGNYYINGVPLSTGGTIDTGSFATTGSNTFYGTQNINVPSGQDNVSVLINSGSGGAHQIGFGVSQDGSTGLSFQNKGYNFFQTNGELIIAAAIGSDGTGSISVVVPSGSFNVTSPNTKIISSVGVTGSLTDFGGNIYIAQSGQTVPFRITGSEAGGNIIMGLGNDLNAPQSQLTGSWSITGSNNIILNGLIPDENYTSDPGLKAYLSGSNNIIFGQPSVQNGILVQSSSVMLPTMNSNILGGYVNLSFTSSSLAKPTFNNNFSLGGNSTIYINHSSGSVTMNGNINHGSIFSTAGTTRLGLITTISNNNFINTTTLNHNSSSISYQGNLGGNITVNNNYSSSVSTAVNNITVNQNTFGGASSTLTVSGSNSGTRRVFNSNIIYGRVNEINSTQSTGTGGHLISTMLLGQGLIVSASHTSATVGGTVIVGRFNATGSLQESSQDTVFVVGTGTNASNRRNALRIDNNNNTNFTGSVNISGSLNSNGNTIITGSLTVTGGINYSSGSNTVVGTVVLDGGNPGVATVSNSLVTANSLIFLTKQTLTNAHMVAVSSKGSGTFTITSNGNGDADTVAYQIINPA